MDDEIIEVTQRLLDAIRDRDWTTYVSLCDPTLTCFEPEAPGQLVTGLQFHRFYFDALGPKTPQQENLFDPVVRELGQDCALITYSRLTQSLDDNGSPVSRKFSESRIWQRVDRNWKLVHLHRSTP